jgi:hypothetical protein
MTISKEKRAELMRKYRAADDKVAATCDAREDAIFALIDAHLNVHDVYQDEGADDDERTAAVEAESHAMHVLIDTDDAYHRALDRWSPLYDEVKALPPETSDETPTSAVH